MITFLWAQSKNGIIGNQGKLPWSIKAEMQHFKDYTMNKTVLMGRNTWESLHIKPLPNRKNIVITSRPMESFENTIVTSDLQSIVDEYINSAEELVVIGGKKIFDSLIDQADKLVISIIDQDFDGDTTPPNWDKENFQLIDEQKHDEFTILTYQRK